MKRTIILPTITYSGYSTQMKILNNHSDDSLNVMSNTINEALLRSQLINICLILY